MKRTPISAVFACALALACSSPNATIAVTTGGEADALGSVATIELDAVDQTGASQTLATATLPNATLDLGDVSQTLVASLQLTGKDASGNAVVFGATPLVELGALSGATIPLFVQRKGELARMPEAIADARTAPLLATTPRSVYFAGGTIAGSSSAPPLSGYDLLLLDGLGSSSAVPAADSFALVTLATTSTAFAAGDDALAVLINDSGLSELGLPNGDLSTLDALPSGLAAWSDLAGGETVMGDDGTAYIVGASHDRPSDVASSAILAFSPAGTGTILASSSRKGAAVAWAPKRGVFVYGGSSAAAAADLIAVATDSNGIVTGTNTTHCTTPDPAAGLAAVAFDATSMLIAGDGNLPRTLDLSKADACAEPWGVAAPPELASPALFALGNGAFLLVGDDPAQNGATRVFRLTAGQMPEEKMLKIPRTGARAIQTSTGAVVILGGGSTTVESYVD